MPAVSVTLSYWILLVACVSVFLGLREIAVQRAEREVVDALYQDWGEVAYYTFHLTWDSPSDFTFAALGQRDTSPWKHHIRALALAYEQRVRGFHAAHPPPFLAGQIEQTTIPATDVQDRDVENQCYQVNEIHVSGESYRSIRDLVWSELRDGV